MPAYAWNSCIVAYGCAFYVTDIYVYMCVYI